MSPAFIAGVTENLTEAEITFDRFHVMKLIGDAVDEVRRAEVKARPELKGTRYVWTKNQPNLTAKQSRRSGHAQRRPTSKPRAPGACASPSRTSMRSRRGRWGELFFDKWIGWAKRSRLEPMKAVARTMEKHRDGILAWFDSRISNGLIEGINCLVQAAKAKARGYRNSRDPEGRHLHGRRQIGPQATHLKRRGARTSHARDAEMLPSKTKKAHIISGAAEK